MATVEIKGIGKVYDGGVRAVDHVTFTVNDREFVVLVGPSGCGKTTTLRMVAGLETLSEGEIYIDGRLVNGVAPEDRDIAMVFQNYALYPHMTVYDNMAFGLQIRKYPKAEIEARVREAAQILDIEELLYRKPKALSGGERQRVAVGRAIVRKPKVFLFDEPLSNLDAKLRVQMRGEISALHNRLQATMIYVTHDQVEAMTMADKIVVMKSGVIQQIGSPLELYNHPVNRFVAGFIGSPPMNFMDVIVKQQGGRIIADEGLNQIEIRNGGGERLRPYIGKKIILGVRPEDLVLRQKGALGKSIKTSVTVIEPLGSEIHLYVDTGNHLIVARVPPRNDVRVGDEAFFEADMKKVIFFDYETEAAMVTAGV